MKKTLTIVAAIIIGFLTSAQSSFAQAKPKRYETILGSHMNTEPAIGASAVEIARDKAQREQSGSQIYILVHPYRFGPNPENRRGCVVNLCPSLVSISDFSFGNSVAGMNYVNPIRNMKGDRFSPTPPKISQYLYLWKVNSPSVISFSISTIEYDAFGNPLPGRNWVIPIDDDGTSKKSNLASPTTDDNTLYDLSNYDINGFVPGTTYSSSFSGDGTSADLSHEFGLLDALPKVLTDSTKQLLPDYISSILSQNHPGAEIGGRSTRFTVVTFISSVRYKSSDGSFDVWKMPAAIKFFSDAYDDGHDTIADKLVKAIQEPF